MIKSKLSKKEICLSALTFLMCHIVLAVVMFLNILINNDGVIMPFLADNVSNIVTVSVSSVILTIIMYVYLLMESKTVLAHCSKIIEIYLLLCISLMICNAMAKFVSPAARPLLFFPLMIAMISKRRHAIFLNSIYMLQMFVFNRFLNNVDIGGSMQIVESFTSLLTIFCAGISGIFLLKRIKTRIGSVLITFVLMIPTVAINFVMQLPGVTGNTWQQLLEIVLFSMMDCVFSVLLFMFMLPVFEAVFSELTSFRLRELTSNNAKLIKKLRQNALGTYNHSVVVAQLAEVCAMAIGEDPELARAAAYYHDVGKLKNPEMFAENQTDYDVHKELTPELSADIIRSHAREGAKLIRKHRLPEFFADVAIEHHGSLPIKYFYAKALKMSDGGLNPNNYSYSGPTPTSKIAAIIMIADASEAATRSITDRTPEKVASLVRSLVEERMNLDQFVDCDITMRELSVITHTVVSQLTGVYHSRVQYPKLVLSKK